MGKTKNLLLSSLGRKIDIIQKIQLEQQLTNENKKVNIHQSNTKKNTKKPANSHHKNQITVVVNETAILIGCLMAIAAAIALSVAIPVSVGNGVSKPLELDEEEIASAISFARDPSFAAGVPQNDSPFPVTGPDWPNDGCGDASVRYKLDGKCYPVLRRGPCPNPLHWIAVDPISLSVSLLFLFILFQVFLS